MVFLAFFQEVTFSVFQMAVVMTWEAFLAFYPAGFYSIHPQSHGNVLACNPFLQGAGWAVLALATSQEVGWEGEAVH